MITPDGIGLFLAVLISKAGGEIRITPDDLAQLEEGMVPTYAEEDDGNTVVLGLRKKS